MPLPANLSLVKIGQAGKARMIDGARSELTMGWYETLRSLVLAFAMVVLGAHAVHSQPNADGPLPQPHSSVTAARMNDYRLGTGDKIRIIVFGEDDLGGEFLVDDTGRIQLPLVGQIQATGLTVHQFEESLTDKLVKGGYLLKPRVSVQVENYRPFYIIGEVNKPGEYPYVSGMNLLNAIALAGGYTYRADQSVVYIRRNGASQEERDPADETTKVNPGDIIRIAERFF